MPIFEHDKKIFIHIPKNGGTSLAEIFLGVKDEFKHYDFAFYESLFKKNLNNYHIFTIVRNPFERILSYFIWHLHFDGFLKTKIKNKDNLSIKEMFNNYIDLIFIQKIKAPTGRDYLTRKTQTQFLLDSNNKINFRIEIIEFKDLNKKFVNVPHKNKKILNLEPKDVYTDTLKEFIYNYFIDDFKNFNYDNL
jgi:hypothetical protein